VRARPRAIADPPARCQRERGEREDRVVCTW
jgi:hypothetical protein